MNILTPLQSNHHAIDYKASGISHPVKKNEAIGYDVTEKVTKSALIFLGALLGLVALATLRWHIQHDSPILLYITFLIDKYGYVPYRDIFDMNMPGTYLAYYLMGRLSGYTDLGRRLVDLSILISMLAFTWLWMREFGRKTAWCGFILWGLVYLTLIRHSMKASQAAA